MLIHFFADGGEIYHLSLVSKHSVGTAAFSDIFSHTASQNFNAVARGNVVCKTAAALSVLGFVSGLIVRCFEYKTCHTSPRNQ